MIRCRLVMRLSLWLVLTFGVYSVSGLAQVNSNVSNATLTASVLQSIAVSVSASTVSFSLLPGSAVIGTPTVPVTTSWNLNPGLVASVKLYAYFSSSTAALTEGADNIPSSDVLASFNLGSFTALTQTGPLGAAGASLLLFTESIGGGNKIKTRNDNVDVKIDLTGLSNLPTGTYVGTLQLQAQAL